MWTPDRRKSSQLNVEYLHYDEHLNTIWLLECFNGILFVVCLQVCSREKNQYWNIEHFRVLEKPYYVAKLFIRDNWQHIFSLDKLLAYRGILCMRLWHSWLITLAALAGKVGVLQSTCTYKIGEPPSLFQSLPWDFKSNATWTSGFRPSLVTRSSHRHRVG